MMMPAVTKAAQRLTEPTSIELFQQIQFQSITSQNQAIDTSYVCQGSGDLPMLLLHGFDSSVLEWRRLLPLLAIATETWAVDLLGFGFSDRSPDLNFSPQAIREHLQEFWQTMIRRPMVIIGASMGGAAAIDFTQHFPEAVDRLILIDSAGLQAPPPIGKLMFPPLDRLATSFLSNPWIRQSISQAAYFDADWASADAQCCAALHLQCPRWQEALITFTKSGGYGNFSDVLTQIQQLTLILWGEQDQILGTKDAAKFQQLLPNSQLQWISDCGHVPHLEKPQTTAQMILSYLELK
jgi:pimeloyl-ACP methyl ester carboxylesterase